MFYVRVVWMSRDKSDRGYGRGHVHDERARAVARVLRASQRGVGDVDDEDWRLWVDAVDASTPAALTSVPGFRNHANDLPAWRDRLDRLDPQAARDYAAGRSHRAEVRQALRYVPVLSAANAVSQYLPNHLEAVVSSGCEDLAAPESHIYPVAATGDLRPETADPQHPSFTRFGELDMLGPKRWGDDTFVFVEADTPSVVLVGIFDVTVSIPAGEHIFRATSNVLPEGGYLMFSEGVGAARFAVQSHLRAEGEPVDPLESSTGGHESQQLHTRLFGDDQPPRYGFISSPGYTYGPLTVDASVMGPGLLHVKEIINYYLFLEDHGSGGFAYVVGFYGRFQTLCWEVVRPSRLVVSKV